MKETLQPEGNADWKALKTGYHEENLSKEIGEREAGENPVVIRTEKGDYYASEFSKAFDLKVALDRQPSMQGSDRFTEIFLETSSGNIYSILYRRWHQIKGGEMQAPHEVEGWYIVNAKENAGKSSKELTGIPFDTQEAMKNSIIKVGEPFRYNQDSNTTRITKITGITGERRHNKGSIQGLPESNIKRKFMELTR